MAGLNDDLGCGAASKRSRSPMTTLAAQSRRPAIAQDAVVSFRIAAACATCSILGEPDDRTVDEALFRGVEPNVR